MSMKSRLELLESIIKLYKKAKSKKQKSALLDHFCAICGYNRKYAIHRINNYSKRRKRKKPGRPSKYNNPNVIKVIQNIWITANLPCSKLLKPIISSFLPFYESHFDKIDPFIYSLLIQISPASIDRVFKSIRPKFKTHGLSTTKPGSILREEISFKTNQWTENRPGYLEADTVAHCGSSVAGTYVLTLDTTDISTTWASLRAIFGKGEQGVKTQVADIENDLPFPLLGFDSDGGSEFFNWHVKRHFTDRKHPVNFTTSRPYKKNDQAHIEQKNWSHVRQYIGYQRLDFPELVPILNDLYKKALCPFINFFIPSVKLISKNRVGSKIIRKHDAPQTPFQRVLMHPLIDKQTKLSLTAQFDSLDPFVLQKQIKAKTKHLFSTLRVIQRKHHSNSSLA